jgi:hypothetical protein
MRGDVGAGWTSLGALGVAGGRSSASTPAAAAGTPASGGCDTPAGRKNHAEADVSPEQEAEEAWHAHAKLGEQDADDEIMRATTPGASSSRNPLVPPPSRSLCVRHQRMADEGMTARLQKVRTQSTPRPSPSLAARPCCCFLCTPCVLACAPLPHGKACNRREAQIEEPSLR